jgi:outer membrane protein TolC
MRGTITWRRAARATVVLAAIALPAAVLAQPLALDLEAAVARALAENPALRAVEEQRRQVAGGIREARADAFPQLDAVSYWSRSRNPSLLNSPDFRDIIDQFPGGSFEPREQELWAAAFEVTQTLYSGGKISAAIDLAEVASTIVEARVRAARLDAATAVAEGFFSTLAARRAAEILELQQAARVRNLEVVDARLEIGEATRLESLRAAASLAEVAPERERLLGDEAVAEARLASLLGLPRDSRLDLAFADGELPALPPLDELVAAAVGRRPELEELALEMRTFDLRQRITRAESKPQVDFDGRYGHTSRLPEDIADSLFADWALLVNLRWSLFDGGRRQGILDQLESEQQQARWQLEDLRRQVEVGVEEAAAAYRAARARHRAALASAAAAEEARRVAFESWQEGVALQSDLLDAQEQEAAAQLAAVAALYDARIAAARLARAVGALPTEPWLLDPSDDPTLRDGAGDASAAAGASR